MSPTVATVLLLSAAGVWLHQALGQASADLAWRPVALADARSTPLPDGAALPLLEAAAAGSPGREEVLLRLGERLDAAGQGDRAASFYRAAARAFPARGLGQYRLALAALREGDEAGAALRMRIAADCAGNHPALLVDLGRWHLEFWRKVSDPGALLKALSFLRRAADRDPDRVGEVLDLLDPVLADPADLVLATPPDPASRRLLGLHLAKRGAAGPALGILDALAAGSPAAADLPVAVARGRCLLALGRAEEGTAVLRDALLARTGGPTGRAVAEVEEALAPLSPADRALFFGTLPSSDPFAALAWARALEAAGDAPGALAAVDAALRTLHPPGPPPAGAAERSALLAAHGMRASLRIGRREVLLAADDLRAAALLDSTPDRWCAAARAFAAGGDRASARSAYERALRSLPPGEGEARAAIGAEMVDRLTGPGKGGDR